MLNMIRARNELQTRVVEHLIQYSNLIGLLLQLTLVFGAIKT